MRNHVWRTAHGWQRGSGAVSIGPVPHLVFLSQLLSTQRGVVPDYRCHVPPVFIILSEPDSGRERSNVTERIAHERLVVCKLLGEIAVCE